MQQFLIIIYIICCFFLHVNLIIFDVVPDLETIKFKVLSRRDRYEIREMEVYLFNIYYAFTVLVLFDYI